MCHLSEAGVESVLDEESYPIIPTRPPPSSSGRAHPPWAYFSIASLNAHEYRWYRPRRHRDQHPRGMYTAVARFIHPLPSQSSLSCGTKVISPSIVNLAPAISRIADEGLRELAMRQRQWSDLTDSQHEAMVLISVDHRTPEERNNQKTAYGTPYRGGCVRCTYRD